MLSEQNTRCNITPNLQLSAKACRKELPASSCNFLSLVFEELLRSEPANHILILSGPAGPFILSMQHASLGSGLGCLAHAPGSQLHAFKQAHAPTLASQSCTNTPAAPKTKRTCILSVKTSSAVGLPRKTSSCDEPFQEVYW